MSQNFKRPASIDSHTRREERQIRLMALQIEDQEQLEILLAGSTGPMREAMLERIRPYLSFTPDEGPIADCPNCGIRRGSAFQHECVLPN